MNELDSQINEGVEMSSEEVFTESFRAGRRTYFFDVKASRNSEFYITITESKRKLLKNGKMVYEKHHVYLYKEDFEKFASALHKVLDFVHENQPAIEVSLPETSSSLPENDEELTVSNFDFEDLDSK